MSFLRDLNILLTLILSTLILVTFSLRFRQISIVAKYFGAKFKSNLFLTSTMLWFVGLIFILLSWRGPYISYKLEKKENRGADIAVVLDISNSMYAQDIAPSRLIRSKMAIKSVLSKLTGDRVSLVTFAGAAMRNSPLTKDYSSLEIFLDEVDPGQIPYQGTNINSAVELAVKTLNKTEKDARVMIFLSDGENHQESLDKSIRLIKNNSVKSIIVSIGSKEGAPVPEDTRNSSSKFKKDRSGNIVLSKANRSLLSEFSKNVGGIFISGNNFDQDLMRGLHSILNGSRSNTGNVTKKIPDEIYYFFLIFGGLLVVFARVLSKGIITGISIFFLFSFQAHTFYKSKISDLYDSQKYEEGESFLESKINNGEDYFFELGNFYYRQGKFDLAKRSYQKSKKERAIYNAGNSAFQTGEFDLAIDYYEKFLKIKPEDNDAKYNLELAKKMKNQKRQESNDQKSSNQDKNQQNNDQKNSDQGKNKENQQKSKEQKKEEKKKNDNKGTQEKKQQKKSSKNNNENKATRDGEKKGKQEKTSDAQGPDKNKNPGDKREEQRLKQKSDKKDEKMSYRSRRLLNQIKDGRKNYQKVKSAQENRRRGSYNGIDW